MTGFPAGPLDAAVARQNAGDLAGAQELYWRILLDDPAQFDALHLLGVSKCQQGRQAEGAWFIARALEQRPEEPVALFNLAMAMAELHRRAEAIGLFDRLLAVRPDHAQAWFNRGNALQSERRSEEAIASYRRALELAPGMPGALANLGAAMLAIGEAEQAVALFRRAIAAGADGPTALINIGHAQEELCDPDAATASYREAAGIAPELAEPRWNLAMAGLPRVADTAAEVEASRPALAAALAEIGAWYDAAPGRDRLQLVWPFHLAYQDRDNRALMERFGVLRSRLMGEWAAGLPRPAVASARDGRLRVGIVSSELYDHSVWQAITRGWFAHLDPDRVALFGFHVGSKSDAETAFARAHAEGFELGQRPLAEWVRVIGERRPDVLIYPAVGMDNLSANLASLRLARVQVASWGHPETTGLPTMDAYLSAEAFEPAGAEAAYSERLIRLPRLGVCYRPVLFTPVAPDLAALGLDGERPIILCPGAPFKYAPDRDDVLSGLVRAVPGAQLVFFHAKNDSPMSRVLGARLARHFAAEGVDFDRHVRFVPFQARGRFHGLIRRADLCLDTIGFSGFNTALQILGNGVPLVGFEGTFMRGRLASGPLRLMGLDELVATEAAEFVAIAARLATDAGYRAAIRERIARAVPALYHDQGSVAALQSVLEGL